MAIDVAYLTEPDGEPPFIHPSAELEHRPVVIGSGGITATQSSNGDVALSFDGPIQQALEMLDESTAQAADDVTRMMGFKARAFLDDDDGAKANIRKGYISSVYYDIAIGWVSELFEVPEEDVALTVFGYLYLSVPVAWVDGSTGIIGSYAFPRHLFSTNPPVTIEGNPYYFTIEESTSYLRRDALGDVPASYYQPSTTRLDFSNQNTPGRMRFLIATTSEDAGGPHLQQIHMGGITLPQSYEGNITGFTVA